MSLIYYTKVIIYVVALILGIQFLVAYMHQNNFLVLKCTYHTTQCLKKNSFYSYSLQSIDTKIAPITHVHAHIQL